MTRKPAPAAAVADEHPFLTARHVDNLIDALQVVGRQFAEEAKARQDQSKAALILATETLKELRAIATHTENLPALVDLLREKSNGHAQHVLDATANGE